MKKLSQVLLIDDDSINNFLSKRIINKLDIAEHVEVLQNGKEALDYISTQCTEAKNNCPKLVILDHNMPVMDGMEFMTAFNQLNISGKSEIIFVLLKASLYDPDIETFKKLGVSEFANKPLSEAKILTVYNKYWGAQIND